ncbi:MAG: hypothetical protein DBY04_01095 [Clostridiales bacterium]|nr:MAG: hypothetical protein DBY04_01095 [Clostridiales bacterium]
MKKAHKENGFLCALCYRLVLFILLRLQESLPEKQKKRLKDILTDTFSIGYSDMHMAIYETYRFIISHLGAVCKRMIK